jgi:hypothetical protein
MRRQCYVAIVAWILAGCGAHADNDTLAWPISPPGSDNSSITYTNERLPNVPWSIHIIRIPRHHPSLQFHTTHARGMALGLATVSDQISWLNSALGSPTVAINGDYYRRSGAFAGEPRGLQIIDGELISAPAGTASFWLDADGEPHAATTESQMHVTWPNGATTPIGLNGIRRPNRIELYTPALGSSTRTTKGRELVLERLGDELWLPLRPERNYRARVREIREGGDTRIPADAMVLSIGPGLLTSLPAVTNGAEVMISAAIQPGLRGVRTAISGGPVLVHNGKRQRLTVPDPDSDSYQVLSMMERHPRSAVGWNQEHFFLVSVDGRDYGYSVGMTLDEWAAYLAKLGCQEAMNLDGGGSTTLWYRGKVLNHPCDGVERPVANSLVVLKKD